MDTDQVRYFARVTAGTEALAWLEIESLINCQRISQAPRTLEFTSPVNPSRMLLLHSVDDIYVWLATIPGLDHTHQSLRLLRDRSQQLDFAAALGVCRQVRAIPAVPSYAITANIESPCNYSRFDVADAIHEGVNSFGWRYIDHRDNGAVADIDIRVLVDGRHARLGIRLGQFPLHRRSYKLASVPGSLKAPVAFCMLELSNPHSNELLLDPMCGAGTILLEAESAWAPRLVVGSDRDPEVIAKTRANCTLGRSEAHLLVADARQLPLANRAVDRICSNLPWGRQVLFGASAATFHLDLLTEVERVLRPHGRAVLLTDQVPILLDALGSFSGLRVALAQQISLFGSHPTILVILKQPQKPDHLRPFVQYHEEDKLLEEAVQAALLSSLSHPEPRLRLLAARACRRSPDRKLRQALTTLTDDPVPQIRDLAGD